MNKWNNFIGFAISSLIEMTTLGYPTGNEGNKLAFQITKLILGECEMVQAPCWTLWVGQWHMMLLHQPPQSCIPSAE